MKFLIAAVCALSLIGCVNEQPQPVQKVKMSAVNEICFETSEVLALNLKEQGENPDKYFSSECGTEEQAKAFKEKNYEVVK